MGGDLHVICIVFVKCQNGLKRSLPPPCRRRPPPSVKKQETLPLLHQGPPPGLGPLSSGAAAGAAAPRRMTSDTPSVKRAIIPATTTRGPSPVSRGRPRMGHRLGHAVGAEEWSWVVPKSPLPSCPAGAQPSTQRVLSPEFPHHVAWNAPVITACASWLYAAQHPPTPPKVLFNN